MQGRLLWAQKITRIKDVGVKGLMLPPTPPPSGGMTEGYSRSLSGEGAE